MTNLHKETGNVQHIDLNARVFIEPSRNARSTNLGATVTADQNPISRPGKGDPQTTDSTPLNHPFLQAVQSEMRRAGCTMVQAVKTIEKKEPSLATDYVNKGSM